MSSVNVRAFGLSIDGFAAGPDQDRDNPMGRGGLALHDWIFPTRTFQQRVNGKDEGDSGTIDDEYAARSFVNIGAWIMGRNMFGPVRGAWPDESWRGWWGESPPFGCDVFVLTHHERTPLAMQDGMTTFHFVTGGIHEALERARRSAGSKDVRVGGGTKTIREFLQAGLIDDLHLAISPVLLGRGENLLEDIDLVKLGYTCTEHAATPKTMHIVLERKANV
jgi:dihydrofolate reductase